MIVFLVAGYRPAAAEKIQKVIVSRFLSVALLLVLAIHLFGTLLRTSAQEALRSNVQKVLAEETTKLPGARLAEVKLFPKHGQTTAWVVIRAPQPFTPEQVPQLNDLVNAGAGRDMGLTVRSVITAKPLDTGMSTSQKCYPTKCIEVLLGKTGRLPSTYQRIPNVSGKTLVSPFLVNARW
jgi:hypothetical protein